MHHEHDPQEVPAGSDRRDLTTVLAQLSDDVDRRHDELRRTLADAVETALDVSRGESTRSRSVLDRLPIGLLELSGQECVWANRTFLSTVGRPSSQVLGAGWRGLLGPHDVSGGEPRTVRTRRPDGTEVVCEVALVPTDDARVLVSVLDVTPPAVPDPAQAERFRRFFENSPLGSVVTDLDGVVRAVNPAYSALTGYRREELLGGRLHEIVLPTTGVYDLPELAQALHAGGVGQTLEVQLVRRDRSVFWSRVSVFPTVDELGSPVIMAQHVEVDDLRYHQREQDERAHRDELTGLPNRSSLLTTLADRLAVRYGYLAVLYCDLDRFKAVNDVLGHAAGDELLRQATERLRARSHSDDVLARLGGDEFVLLVPGADEEQAIETAARIQRSFSSSFLVQDEEITCGISVGICVLDLSRATGTAAATVLDDAETAMAEAKNSGRGNSQVFSPKMRDNALRRVQVEQELRLGIENGELRVHYQPIVRLADGRRTGYEALVRWNHPQRGLLLPGEFLDVAQECGLGQAIDTLVLREAVGFLSRHPGTGVSINISPRRLDGSFAEAVLLQLARAGVEASRLSVELLETSLLTIDSTTTRELQTLSAAGCALFIDDFGTGYSALSYLRRLPVTGLKLDRSFVADLPLDPDADRIASAVAGLAAGFGIASIAEGVESADVAAHLRAQGWTSAQGWFFGRPAPEEVWYPATVRVDGVALAS